MVDEIKEIPKELQLEQNKFVQILFKSYLGLMERVRKLEEGKDPATKTPEPETTNEKWENIKRYGDNLRTSAMTTRRDIRLINGEGKLCCFYCDGVIKGYWRQVINIEACDPECAAQLEGLFATAVHNNKITLTKLSKK